MNSATLPSGTSPNSSVETTLRRLGAKRCSLIAMAVPLISRESPTTNASSFTGAPVSADRASDESGISISAVRPASIVTGCIIGARPV